MLLINEKGKLTDYDVQFKDDKYTKDAVELKLQNLLSNPKTRYEEERIIRKREEELNCSMNGGINSPLICQREFITENVNIITRKITYSSPFTIAFLMNKSSEKWEFDSKNWYNEYLDLKSRIVDTNNLSLLLSGYPKAKRELLLTTISKLKAELPGHLSLLFPDIVDFSIMFPLTEFRNTGHTDSQIVEMYDNRCLDESHMDKLSRLVDFAKSNTKVLSVLNLQPNIIK